MSLKHSKIHFKFQQSFAKRANFKFISSLVAIILVGILLTNWLAVPAYAAWFDDSFAYRNAVPISSHTAAENNVYISATIDTSASGQFQADCGDLRFTDYNGNVLNYYVVSGCTTASTVVHVFFDSMPAGAQTLYYYYGNPQAANGFNSSDFATQATSYAVGSIGSQEKGGAPVAYWSFNDGTGTVAQDASQNNNDGTITGATWQTEDMCVSGKCLKLNGSSNYVTPTSNSLSGTTYTTEAWFKATSTSGSPAIISQRSSTDSDSIMGQLYFSSGKIAFITRADDGNNSAVAVGTTTLNANVWYHATGVRDGANVYVYLNGKLEGSDNDAGGTITTNVSDIGRCNAGGTAGCYFPGFIDDIKIYNYARTAAQVKSDFSSRGSQKGSSASIIKNQSSISNGLVAYYKMDEASANLCTGGVNDSCDSSGNANNGAWINDTTSTAGKFGNGVIFDGTGDYADFVSSSTYELTEAITLSFWIKTSSSANSDVVGRYQNGANTRSYNVTVSNGVVQLRLSPDGTSTNAYYISSTTQINNNAWNHVVFTFDKQFMRLYVNGSANATPVANTNSIYAGTGGALFMGRIYTAGDFNGSLDDVRIYNRALSPREVRDLYNWAPSPRVYLKMEEGAGTSANDDSGNARTGTLNGNPIWAPGKYGKGVKLDGTGDYVQVSDF